MAYTYGDFGKWELDEDEGILACSLFWADENTNLHLAILVLNRVEFVLHVDRDDNDSMEPLFSEAKEISHCKMVSVLDEKSVLVDFSGHNLVFRKDQYEVVSGALATFGVDTGIESNDQIRGKNLDNMPGVDFEKLILRLVRKMGFEAETTRASGDGGVDIVAYSSQPFLEGKYIIQCKRWGSSVGEPILRDLYGVVMSERANKGILVTTGNFTSGAIRFAEGKPIELIDGDRLIGLLEKYNFTSEENYTGGNITGFNLEDWIGSSNFNDYIILKEELTNSRSNLDARYKIVCVIIERIMNNIHSEYEATNSEIDMLIAECRKHLSILENSQPVSKRDIGLKFISRLFNAQLHVLQGNLIEALKGFHDVLNWDSIRWTYPRNTVGNGSYKYGEALFAIVTNVIRIYCALGLFDKARLFSKSYDKLFNEMLKEVVWYSSVDNIDNVTIYDNAGEVDFAKSTIKFVNSVRNCTGDFFLFWDENNYKLDSGAYEIYNKESDLYYFSFGTQYHLTFNEQTLPDGVVGYPRWGNDINIKDIRNRVNLLF